MLKNIVIVSPGDDVHALAVKHRLRALYGDAVRVTIFDPATSPIDSTISWSSPSRNENSGPGADFEANITTPLAENIGPKAGSILRNRAVEPITLWGSSIHSIWLRRPRDGIIHHEVDIPEHREFATDSVNILLRSFLEAANTYNPYFVEWRASQKPLQLWAASSVGLPTPRTVITSVPEKAREFYRHLRQEGAECVYKRIGTTRGFNFATRLVDDHALERVETLQFAPVILQERIAGGPNIRVAVVGSNIYSAEWRCENQQADPVDIRDEECATMWPAVLPDRFKILLLKLHQKLQLVFGIYDLKYDSKGELYFLEVNPSGQWLDLEYEAGHPISETWARVLVDGRNAAASHELALLTSDDLNLLGTPSEQTQVAWVRYV